MFFSLLIRVKKILIFIYRPCLCWTVVLGLLFWPCFRQESLITIRVTLFHDSSIPFSSYLSVVPQTIYTVCLPKDKRRTMDPFCPSAGRPHPISTAGQELSPPGTLTSWVEPEACCRPVCVCVTGIVEYDHRCSSNGEKPDSCGYKSTLLRRERRWLYRQGQWDGCVLILIML